MEKKNKTVFVGLSGGVDSSVAALRLKNQGYNVVGVFIKVWHPDFLECNWEMERLDAMRVAAHLDIPFLMCDAEEAYKKGVADYFIAEYKAGRTPNPDVMCNRAVKFGAFLEFALERGADYIATGHYAQKVGSEGSNPLRYELHRGVDANKDQTYFLWTLTQEQLTHVLLPVGDTQKEKIREEAKKANIPVATKKDSQGICFLGHVDIPDFLSHYIDLQPGSVLNESGEVIGSHKGVLAYTLGQRHGITYTSQNTHTTVRYVTNINMEANTLTVSEQKPTQQKGDTLTLESVNIIGSLPGTGETISVQTRYRQSPAEATIEMYNLHARTLRLQLVDQHEVYAIGQSCVLYSKDVCFGGGIIAS